MEDVAPIEGTADGVLKLANPDLQKTFTRSKQLIAISQISDHKIGISKLCSRFGYRADYLLNTGVTIDHVAY